MTSFTVTFLLIFIVTSTVNRGDISARGEESSERSQEVSSNINYDYLIDEYIPYKQPKQKKTSDEETSGEEVTFDVTNYQLTNLTVSWDQLGWKVLCDEDEWKEQFAAVRVDFTRCVELSRIVLPGERDTDSDKQLRAVGMIANDGVSNPMCRLSRNWLSCYHHLKQVPCLDADPVTFEAKKEANTVRETVEKFLPTYKKKHSWIAMHRAYKWHCLASKALISSIPFGSFLPFMG